MKKMLFNTGVKPWNHTDKKGRLITGKHDVWVNDELNIEYFIENDPPKNSRLDYLAQGDFKPAKHQIAIKIVGGGMLSEFAVFTVFDKAKS